MNVNSALLTMAIMEGLTMAIANPNQEMLVNAAFSSDILMAKDGADLQYINRMNAIKEAKEAFLKANPEAAQISGLAVKVKQKSTAADTGKNASGMQPEGSLGSVKEAVLKGKQRDIVEITKTAVEDGFEPQQILNEALMPAINEVGDLFDKGKYFSPQLIASAETMKKSIDYLEPMLKKDGVDADMPTVVIATVKGDIHDIGKNLVALMLKNHGFTVVDLGKDVPREEIIEAARKYNARIIALSALMTTTMQEMKQVIDLAKQEGIEAKVMIGGAVITQDYADEIGADGYSRDAADAVKLAQRLCE